LAVLRAFGDHERAEVSLSEVATRAQLSPATARCSLNTLVRLGYARQRDRFFMLRPTVLEFGAAFLGAVNLQSVAQPFLLDVCEQTGDSTSLTVLEEQDIIHL
jgi:IclR family pca regulon transcriptional regulator